jgi:hypothetical protein
VKDLTKPQFYRDWNANEWVYECFTCMRYSAYAPTKRHILKQVELHDKECLNGWA